MGIKTYIYIFIGGGLGSLFRFIVSDLTNKTFGNHFPHGTLAVNILGSFIIGFLFYTNEQKLPSIPEFKQFIFIGFLGGFTTFSSFSLETINLFLEAKFISGLVNIFLNLMLCLISVATGYSIGKII